MASEIFSEAFLLPSVLPVLDLIAEASLVEMPAVFPSVCCATGNLEPRSVRVKGATPFLYEQVRLSEMVCKPTRNSELAHHTRSHALGRANLGFSLETWLVDSLQIERHADAVMTGLSASELFELRSSILALSEECPADECNPVDCPLFALRQMPPEQRLEWLRALSPAEISFLAAYHHVCMNIKLGARARQGRKPKRSKRPVNG